jgi:hypothetical protein
MTSSVFVVADGLHLVEPDLLAGVEDERGDLLHHLPLLLPHPVQDLRRFPGQLLRQMLQLFCINSTIKVALKPTLRYWSPSFFTQSKPVWIR